MKDILQWFDVFCKSFDITENKNSILDIIIKNKRKFTFLVTLMHINENEEIPVGCGLLFESENCMSLYCLGTIPEYRNKGIARNTILTAMEIAHERKYRYIYLHTFQNEYINMYKKINFKLVNKKVVYSKKVT